jgi:hypothetical protein
MTHPMPDQTDTPTAKRMTTAEVAALAQGVDNRLDDLSAVVTDLATQLQDRATAHAELRDDVMGRLSGARPDDAPTREQVDARIHEALAPLHDEVHELRRQNNPATAGNMDAILARLEDAERKVAAVEPGALTERVATELHPGVAELRRRLAAVEEAVKAQDGDPASHTLAEDHLADQVQVQVEAALSKLSGLSDTNTARVDQLVREFEALRAYVDGVEARRDPDYPNRPVAKTGTGAAKKVLQLMRAVTHIGKEKEANLGQGGRFKFRGVDDAMDAVGHAMRDVGVILGTEILKDETHQTPITKAGTNKDGTRWENTVVWTLTKLTVRYTFTDPEDGSTHSLEMTGEGRDASDKSTSKAASMALKYGLFQALMVPVNGLDDSDAAPPQRMEQEHETPAPSVQVAPAPQAAPERTDQQKAQRAGEALAAIRNVYRVEGGPQAQYNRLVQIMNQVSSEGLLEFTVEGSSLNQHGQAAMRTLQAPPPPDDARASTEPPEPPEDYR